MTKVWRKSVDRYWRYRGNIKLQRESRTDARRHGRTDARTDSGTDGRPENIIASAGAYRRRRLKNNDWCIFTYTVSHEYNNVTVIRKVTVVTLLMICENTGVVPRLYACPAFRTVVCYSAVCGKKVKSIPKSCLPFSKQPLGIFTWNLHIYYLFTST